VCLPYLTSLTRLALESNLIGNNNDLDDDTMREFAAVLANKGQLQTLGLEYNRIRSRGANHVFTALKMLPNFERLFFSHNLIGEDSAQQILDLLTHSGSLREIRLNDNT
jgi:Ran GTPase-activating protein (RanGAP) involved in mRNA processing and transport